MSGQMWALFGVLLGAVLAGGASLLLAWRQETVEARAGIQVAVEILDRTRSLIHPLVSQCESRWWRVGFMPTTESWRAYRRAIAARLPYAAMAQVERAMAMLDAVNTRAAQAVESSDQSDARVWEAMVAEQDEDKRSRLLDEHRRRHSPLAITAEDRRFLRDVAEQSNAALAELTARSPARTSGDAKLLTRLRAWLRWHKRPLTGTALAAVAVGIALMAWPRTDSPAQHLEHILATHLQGEALTACEAIDGHDTRFSCVVVTQENHATCTADTGRGTARIMVAGLPTGNNSGGCGKSALAEAAEYLATEREGHDCAAFAVVKDVVSPSSAEQSRPRWRAKLLRQLQRGIRHGIAAADLPTTLVPDSVMPGASFIGCD